MKVSIISFTARGDDLNRRICELLAEDDIICQCGKTFKKKSCSLSEWTGRAFAESDVIIFVGATGIAVRASAPYICRKDKDPAVITVDESAGFVIPILSGHIGGGNAYSGKLAKLLSAQAVITTATDINGVFAVDTWAAENGYAIDNIEEIKYISGALLGGEAVGIVSDFEITGKLPKGIAFGTDYKCGICISDKPSDMFSHTLKLLPKRFIIGVGSKKNADEQALTELVDKIGINKKAVAAVATIDIKRNEKSVLALTEYLGAELKLYSTDELNNAEGEFTTSEFVKRITGTDNVCERSAAAAGGKIIVKKTRGSGVTMAVSAKDWSVSFEHINGGRGL